MIAWGVKLKKDKEDDMQIVSNMAKAHVKVMEDGDNEVYKLDILDSGEPIILDGPFVVVDSETNVYGMPKIAHRIIAQFVSSVLMVGLFILFVVTNSEWLLFGWAVSVIMWLKAASGLTRILDDRIKYLREFLADLSDEIGS